MEWVDLWQLTVSLKPLWCWLIPRRPYIPLYHLILIASLLLMQVHLLATFIPIFQISKFQNESVSRTNCFSITSTHKTCHIIFLINVAKGYQHQHSVQVLYGLHGQTRNKNSIILKELHHKVASTPIFLARVATNPLAPSSCVLVFFLTYGWWHDEFAATLAWSHNDRTFLPGYVGLLSLLCYHMSCHHRGEGARPCQFYGSSYGT